jgi:dTDP-4-dehydrorhamnose 3,5-epimerase
MTFSYTPISDLIVFEPMIHKDNRGYFLECYNKKIFDIIGNDFNFVQENQVFSVHGTIRGLHFQLPPFAQGKLVRAISGELLDVAVDIREDSPTFGMHYKIVLSEENQKQLWIPPGFAHGVLTLSETSRMAYFCTENYSEEYSRGIRYNDPDLNIDWGNYEFILTNKDRNAPLFSEMTKNKINGRNCE